MNALSLEGIWSMTEGLAALTHDIAGLRTLLGWRASAGTPSGCLLMGHGLQGPSGLPRRSGDPNVVEVKFVNKAKCLALKKPLQTCDGSIPFSVRSEEFQEPPRQDAARH